MIPQNLPITQTDTLPGEEVEFSIGDARWVMRTQADLYSNRELAVAREYSTNARDAMVESGKGDQPIEVTLPSLMNPYFKVRDYGDGMSREVMTSVYTKFGSSTKRNSNQFNGMLGYGCKSAIAYTESFTVASIHEGVKNIAVITRKPDWSIVMKIIATMPTDEASGTEVTVPVHNWQEFTHKANDFYKFWMQGTVLVNGQFPVQDVGEKITDNLYYANSSGWGGKSYVVMGNVAYRIENPEALFRDSRLNRINFVAYVDNGDVEFTPSREDLKYTQHTKDTLHKVIADFEKKIIAEAKADIDSATSHTEAYEKWTTWTERLGKSLFADLEFQGDKFSDNFKIDAMRYSVGSYRYSTHRINEWNVGSMKNTLVITGFTPVDLNSGHKAKVREYRSLKGLNVSYALFTTAQPSDITTPWVDTSSERFVDWEDLKAAIPKKPRQPRAKSTAPGRIPGTFDYWTKDGRQYEKSIPVGKTVYYVRAKEVKPKTEAVLNPAHVLEKVNDDGVVVLLAANRIEKFTRENPQAIDFLKHFRSKVVVKGESLLSAEAKRALNIGHETRDWLRKMDTTKIDDPAFATTRALIESSAKLTKAYDENLALAQSLNMWYTVERYSASGNDESILKPYPLLDSLRSGYSYRVNMEHVYIYINAVYAATKKGN